MKICPHPKCGKEHEKSGTFCSRSCANSRAWSPEARRKKSIANKGKKKIYQSLETKQRANEARLRGVQTIVQRRVNRILETPPEQLDIRNRRQKIINEQELKCNKCTLSEWLGQPIMLELEHKDGNNQNNKRENLEMLCPNCHSQTPTWRGRDRNKEAGNLVGIHS